MTLIKRIFTDQKNDFGQNNRAYSIFLFVGMVNRLGINREGWPLET
jgi:hypothetical protein